MLQQKAKLQQLVIQDQDGSGLFDPSIETDVAIILKNYMIKDFSLDFIANIPVAIFLITRGIPDEDVIATDYVFMTVMLLKNARLAHIYQVYNLLRKISDLLSDKFNIRRVLLMNLLSWSLAVHENPGQTLGHFCLHVPEARTQHGQVVRGLLIRTDSDDGGLVGPLLPPLRLCCTAFALHH